KYSPSAALALVAAMCAGCADGSDGDPPTAEGSTTDTDAPDANAPNDAGEGRDSGTAAPMDGGGGSSDASSTDAAFPDAALDDAGTTEAPEAGASPTLLDDPLGTFPQYFSQVGLYPRQGTFETV